MGCESGRLGGCRGVGCIRWGIVAWCSGGPATVGRKCVIRRGRPGSRVRGPRPMSQTVRQRGTLEVGRRAMETYEYCDAIKEGRKLRVKTPSATLLSAELERDMERERSSRSWMDLSLLSFLRPLLYARHVLCHGVAALCINAGHGCSNPFRFPLLALCTPLGCGPGLATSDTVKNTPT